MALEVTGKTLKYYQNGVEQAIKSINFGRQAALLDATNSSTASAGTESVTGRIKSTIKIDTDMLNVLGAEVVTGTLTAGSKYLVTASATTFDGLWAVGDIFESDGTETASGTEKVKPLGAKITGKTLSMTVGGSAFKVTNMTFEKKFAEIDSTTSATASPYSEAVTGRIKYTSKVDCIMYRTTAEQISGDPTSQAVVLTFATGLTVTGNALFHQMDITDEVSGICKVSYQMEWVGAPVEVGIGYLTCGTSQTFAVIFEKGTSTNKALTGNVVLTDMSVSADVNQDVKISYSGTVNGAITPSVYS